MTYDYKSDVLAHKQLVKQYMDNFIDSLFFRAIHHDDSKLEEPESTMFVEWTPKLKLLDFGSDEYRQALSNMGDALKCHYDNNYHHPEHFENGINGMTLIDLLEMVCDWKAAAQAKQVPVNLEYLSNRFGISSQLVDIIFNTVEALE